jgi:hypothetical protein
LVGDGDDLFVFNDIGSKVVADFNTNAGFTDVANLSAFFNSIAGIQASADVGLFEGVQSTRIHYIDTGGNQATLTLRDYNITPDANVSDDFVV